MPGVTEPDARADLRAAIEALDKGIQVTRERLQREHPDVDPWLMQDTNMRPLLLDAVTARANALAALVRLDDHQHPGLKEG